MRLTCPNCGAQYEVPDDVISETGRDVQCSNCGDTWFQRHPDHMDTPEVVPQDRFLDEAEPDDSDDTRTVQAAADAGADAAPPDAPEPDTAPPDQTAGHAALPRTQPAAAPAARRELDPAVADVLRQEAEREARVRASARGNLETQPDLGLEDNDSTRRDREARERMARLRGRVDQDAPDREATYDDSQDTSEIDPGPRRALLPDIEEINSSLRSSHSDTEPVDPSGGYAEPPPPSTGPGAFRRGFRWAVAIIVLLLLLYLLAPMISSRVPALAGVLSDYTVMIDGWRVWLDQQVAALMAWLDSMTGGPTQGTDS